MRGVKGRKCKEEISLTSKIKIENIAETIYTSVT